jgi:hypothetical protein
VEYGERARKSLSTIDVEQRVVMEPTSLIVSKAKHQHSQGSTSYPKV